jgi:hypothetical protein
VPAIWGGDIDTRALTKRIRSGGSLLAKIVCRKTTETEMTETTTTPSTAMSTPTLVDRPLHVHGQRDTEMDVDTNVRDTTTATGSGDNDTAVIANVDADTATHVGGGDAAVAQGVGGGSSHVNTARDNLFDEARSNAIAALIQSGGVSGEPLRLPAAVVSDEELRRFPRVCRDCSGGEVVSSASKGSAAVECVCPLCEHGCT